MQTCSKKVVTHAEWSSRKPYMLFHPVRGHRYRSELEPPPQTTPRSLGRWLRSRARWAPTQLGGGHLEPCSWTGFAFPLPRSGQTHSLLLGCFQNWWSWFHRMDKPDPTAYQLSCGNTLEETTWESLRIECGVIDRSKSEHKFSELYLLMMNFSRESILHIH